MPRIRSRSLALISAVALSAAAIVAAQRPVYGGRLRIALHASPQTVLAEVYQTLVTIDNSGKPAPLLATSWVHDPMRRKWVFTPRPNVILNDGTTWDPLGGSILIDDRKSIENILRDLADPKNGMALETGPFHLAKSQADKQFTLEANDRYWGGRPYLDEVDIDLGRSLREAVLDFDLGKLDVVELPVSEIRKAQQRGITTAISRPMRTLALVFDNPNPDLNRARNALALGIDRAAIHNVLLQKQGEISGALLPQWLSGYAFLFNRDRNITKAKELAAGAPALSLSYDRQNTLMRAIAERIILNASEIGLNLRPATGNSGDVRLTEFAVRSADREEALHAMAEQLKATLGDGANLYERESLLIDTQRLVPLLQIPVAYELSPAVHGWNADQLRLENVWVETRDVSY